MKTLFSAGRAASKKNTGHDDGRIYLDHAAASPMLFSASNAMHEALRDFSANPSSIHADGVRAKAALEASRKVVASVFDVHPSEILFTGSGTESDNLAIVGSVTAALETGLFPEGVHVVTTAIEHPAVLATCNALERSGVAVTYLPVGHDGLVEISTLREALRPETVLVTIGYANSEIGTVQPLKEIAKAIRHFKKLHGNPNAQYPLFHTDACQATPYLTLRVPELGVDMLTANGAKIGGPRGIGMLYVHRTVALAAVSHGGGQEKGLRSGTEDVASIKGFEAALVETRSKADSETKRILEIRDICFAELKDRFKSMRINGSMEHRLPQNVNVSFPGIGSELLVLELDARGISVSAGSACGSAKEESSHVLEALYPDVKQSEWGTVRATFGPSTRERDIFALADALDDIFEKYSEWLPKESGVDEDGIIK